MKAFWTFFTCFWLIIIGVNATGMWDYALRDILWTMQEHPERYYAMLIILLIVGVIMFVFALRGKNGRKH